MRTHGTQPGTYLFLTPGGFQGDGVGIFQDNGTLVWWQRASASRIHDATLVHYRGRPYLAVFSGNPAPYGPVDVGVVTLYDEHYRKVGSITTGPPFAGARVDNHEFQLTPQGDALVGLTEPVRVTVHGHPVTVLQYVVQKLSLVQDAAGIHTGRVLFQWNSLRDVPVSQSHLADPGRNGVWDYFHGNAIAQDSDGNLLVSARNTWGIYKISLKTGHVMWQVGAKGDHVLQKQWCYQHALAALGHHHYALFDDGGEGPGCAQNSTRHAARGLIIRVDPSGRPAGVRLVRSYRHDPAVRPVVCGGVQPLADGSMLVDWGNVPVITQYDPTGQSVDMDLSLSSWSYRAFRFSWDGRPLTRPAVAARFRGTGIKVWASWNGSTEVTAWQVLAGDAAGHLSPLGRPHPRAGFETAVMLKGPHNLVAVQALGAEGSVLARSKPVAPSPARTATDVP